MTSGGCRTGTDRNVVARNKPVDSSGPRHIRAELFAPNTGVPLNAGTPLLGNGPTRTPIADDVLPCADCRGELPHPPSLVDCFCECVHSRSITLCDPHVNTNRVRRASRSVKNGAMAFSDNLKRLRIAARLTQEELALACGWSGQSRIANYESSSVSGREPKVSEVPLIARALGVPVAELFGEAPSASQSVGLDAVKLAESIAALRQVAKKRGWSYDPETHPEETLFAYQLRMAMPAEPTTAQVIDFGQAVADRLLKSAEAEPDGQGNGGKASGANRKRA